MSNAWYITPYTPPNWETVTNLSINPQDYREKLQQRFPFAQIHSGETYFLLGWDLDESSRLGISGGLQIGGQVVSFRPHGVNFLEFILWHRQYVPEVHQLFLFCDSDLTRYIELKMDTTLEEIMRFTGARKLG